MDSTSLTPDEWKSSVVASAKVIKKERAGPPTSNKSIFLNTLPSSDEDSSDDELNDPARDTSRSSKLAFSDTSTKVSTASVDVPAILLKIGHLSQKAMEQKSASKNNSYCIGSANEFLPAVAGWKLHQNMSLPMPLTSLHSVRTMQGVKRFSNHLEIPASILTFSNPTWSRGLTKLMEERIIPQLGGWKGEKADMIRPVLKKMILLDKNSMYKHTNAKDTDDNDDIRDLMCDEDTDSEDIGSTPMSKKSMRCKKRPTPSIGMLAIQLPSQFSGGSWNVSKGENFISGEFPNKAFECYYMAIRSHCDFRIETVHDGLSSVLLYSLDYIGCDPPTEDSEEYNEMGWITAEIGRLLQSLPQENIFFGLPFGSSQKQSKLLDILSQATNGYKGFDWVFASLKDGEVERCQGVAWNSSWISKIKIGELIEDGKNSILVPESEKITKQCNYQGEVIFFLSEGFLMDHLLENDFDFVLVEKSILKSKPHLLEQLERYLQSNKPTMSIKQAYLLMKIITMEECYRGLPATDFGMAQVVRCLDTKELLSEERFWYDISLLLEKNAVADLSTSSNLLQAIEPVLTFHEKLGVHEFLQQARWILRIARDIPDATFAMKLLEMNLVLFKDSKSSELSHDNDLTPAGELIVSLSNEFDWFQEIKCLADAVFDQMKDLTGSMIALSTKWEVLNHVESHVPLAHLQSHKKDVLADFAESIEQSIYASSTGRANTEVEEEALRLPQRLVNALMEDGSDSLFFKLESCLTGCSFENLEILEHKLGRHPKAQGSFARKEFTDSIKEKLKSAKVQSLRQYGSKLLDMDSTVTLREDWASYTISVAKQDFSWDDILPSLQKCFDRIGRNADRFLMNQRWRDLVKIQRSLPEANLEPLVQRAIDDFVKLIVGDGWDKQAHPDYMTTPPMADQYDSILRASPQAGSFLISISGIANPEFTCCFAGYSNGTDGETGPAQLANAIKSPGDVVVAIQGRSMRGKSFDEVVSELQSHLPRQYCCVRWGAPTSTIFNESEQNNPLLLALLEHGEDDHFDQIQAWVRATPSDQLKSFWSALPGRVTDLRSEVNLSRLRFLQKEKEYRDAAAASPPRKKARLSGCPP